MKEKTKSYNWPTIIPAILMALLFILSGYIPIEELWGFNHLKYFSDYLILGYAIIIILFFVPAFSRGLSNSAADICRSFNKLPLPSRIIIVAAVSAAIFYFLRVHVHALGDGYQRIYQIEKGYMYYHSEPLDFLLHAVLYRIFEIFGIASGELSYIVISILGGAAFVSTVVLFKIPVTLKENAGLIKILVIAFGGSLMFFGYVESYTFYYIFGLLYILNAVRFLMDGRGFFAASIFLALAIASHLTAMVYLPSYIFLAYRAFKTPELKTFNGRLLPIIIVLIPTLGLIGQEIWLRVELTGYVPSVAGGILPLVSSSEYAAFSLGHLFEILNQALLIIPVSIIIFLGAIFSKKVKESDSGFKVFSLISIIAYLLMIFLLDPKLGMARDWDLFATVTASLGLIIIFYFLAGWITKPDKYSKTLVAGLSIIFMSGWIIANASTGRQLSRSEDLLALSDRGREYSTELLAHYYKNVIRDDDKALEILLTIPEDNRNARVWNKIAKAQIGAGQFREAMNSIYRGLEKDSEFAELHSMAGAILTRFNDAQNALPHIKKACYLDPQNHVYFYSLGGAYFRLDSLPEAAEAFKRVIDLKPDYAPGYIEYANISQLMGNFDTAYVYIQRGLKLNPNFPGGYELLNIIKKSLEQTRGQ